MPIFDFDASYGITVNYSVITQPKELGDCLEFLGIPAGKIVEESWDLSGIIENLNTVNIIQSYQGIDPFQWRLRKPVLTPLYTWELEIDELGEYVADKWTLVQQAPGLWKFSTNFSKWYHWFIDECSIKESDLADDYLTYPFEITYNSTRNFDLKILKTRKQGGIETRAKYGYNSSFDTWNINKVVHESEKTQTNKFLSNLAGQPFYFRGLVYTCISWSNNFIAPSIWEINLNFKRTYQPYRKSALKEAAEKYDICLSREEVLLKFQESVNNTNLDEHLDGAISWLLRWQKADYPYILNAQYVLRNSFHKVLGRGGYFPSSGAPTEAQAVIVRACAFAFKITGDIRYKNLAINCAKALLNYFYPLPIPANWTPSLGIRVPHWLITTESFVTKGKVSSDPLNFGFFDLVLNFSNGIATIPIGSPHFGELLSDVYRVYPVADQLLWQNVYAEPLGGFWYEVDYWTSNILLEGVIVRYYPESSQPGGKSPTNTNDQPGIIKLKSNYTGQAKVVYSAYVGGTVPANTGFEAHPMWRLLLILEARGAIDVFPWASDAFELMQEIDPTNPMWKVAYDCNKFTENISAQVINLTYWYQKEPVLNPFAYPGSQVVVVPKDDRIVNNSRVTTPGDKLNFLKIDIPASSAPFPSIEFSNYAVTATFDEDTTVYVEASASVNTELEIIISLEANPFNFSKYYKRYLPVTANQVTTANINPKEFVLWDLTQNVWNTRIADNPIYNYSGGGGSVNYSKDYPVIDGIITETFKIELESNSGFAGAGFVTRGIAPDLAGKQPTLPLKMQYKVEGKVVLKLTIDEKEYRKTIEETDGFIKTNFAAIEFKNNDENPSGNLISNIEFVATSEESTIWVSWIGAEPNRLLGTMKTYKAVISSRVRSAHTLWIGDFRAIGSPSDILPYSPGVVPFTVNVFDDGSGNRQIIEGWRGAPATGYQYPGWYIKIGYWDRLRQVLQYLEDAQVAYKEQNENKTFGAFAPTYLWGTWDNLQFENGSFGFFSFKGVDPNTNWEGYQIRPAESVAHAWYRMVIGEYPNDILLPPDFEQLKAQAKKVTMGFVNWLSGFYLRRVSFKPPTDFKAVIDPEVNYHTVHFAAIALRMFIYANLADTTGKNAAVTLRGIKASYNYLICQYISDPNDLMQGSFFKSQPSFVFNGLDLNEGFGFHQSEVIEALALLKEKQHLLRIPECCIFLKTVCPT